MYSYRMDSWMLEAVLRLLLASVLGAIIGAEREHHGRSAGFRTHLLTALGAALAITVSLHFGRVFGTADAGGSIRVDPARLAYGVMVGIGFLGAGAMIRQGAGIRGLTTAASLWCTAAVGLACGFGMYIIAATAAALVLFALVVLSKLDRYIPSRRHRIVTLTLPLAGDDVVARVQALLNPHRIFIVNIEYLRNFEKASDTVRLHVTTPPRTGPGALLKLKDDLPELLSISVR